MAVNRSLETHRSLEILEPILLFVTTGKPTPLQEQLIKSGSERDRQKIMNDATMACAESVETGALVPATAAKRVGALIRFDDSNDHNRICLALEEADREKPKAVQQIVACLSTNRLFELDPTTGPSAELLIDYATAQQLATLARYYTGKIYAAKTRASRFTRDEISYEFYDEDLRAQARVKEAARGLGRLLDLIVDRNDADSDGLLELFGAALLGDQEVPLKSRTKELALPSFMIEQIVDMAINRRSSAARVIESLPDGDPNGWEAKMTLRRNIT